MSLEGVIKYQLSQASFKAQVQKKKKMQPWKPMYLTHIIPWVEGDQSFHSSFATWGALGGNQDVAGYQLLQNCRKCFHLGVSPNAKAHKMNQSQLVAKQPDLGPVSIATLPGLGHKCKR